MYAVCMYILYVFIYNAVGGESIGEGIRGVFEDAEGPPGPSGVSRPQSHLQLQQPQRTNRGNVASNNKSADRISLLYIYNRQKIRFVCLFVCLFVC